MKMQCGEADWPTNHNAGESILATIDTKIL
jgi:hypothetical protein